MIQQNSTYRLLGLGVLLTYFFAVLLTPYFHHHHEDHSHAENPNYHTHALQNIFEVEGEHNSHEHNFNEDFKLHTHSKQLTTDHTRITKSLNDSLIRFKEITIEKVVDLSDCFTTPIQTIPKYIQNNEISTHTSGNTSPPSLSIQIV